jgi:hypothetical protein
MAKLTLNVNEQVIARAKEVAKKSGTSLSQMVETYLDFVAKPRIGTPAQTPITDSLIGILDSADIKDYRRYLERKYR